MLILTRKIGESIAIGDQIKVKVLEIKGGQAKLGIEAPAAVTVHREEIFNRIMEENKRAAAGVDQDLQTAARLLGSQTVTNSHAPSPGITKHESRGKANTLGR